MRYDLLTAKVRNLAPHWTSIVALALYLTLVQPLSAPFASALSPPQDPGSTKQKREIVVATQISYGAERAIFTRLLNDYEKQHPETQITIRFFRGDYSDSINAWIQQGSGPELFYWYSGAHTDRLAREGKLRELSAVWQKSALESKLDSYTVEAVMYQGRPYAIPVSFYPWTFYYRASLFEKYQLNVPQNWAELINACKVFSAEGRSLISLGHENIWPSLIWFDYLSLRLWGKDFYLRLLGKKAQWNGEEVREVLVYLKQAIDAKCFNTQSHRELNLVSALPRLYHERALMQLTGAYTLGNLPKSIRADFRAAPFPKIKDKLAMFTVVPVDTYSVPYYAKLDEHLLSLLSYLANQEFQLQLNMPASRLPPNLEAQPYILDALQRETLSFIDQAPRTLYFDRESHPQLAMDIAHVLVDFFDKPDIELTLKRLKSASDEFYRKHPEFALEY
ncbi:ABC transporter substrate-binding protein [Agaribacterium haliotis]|uniref:ABC transporter substrate-binding protein n=1 Tax=Agaribacterium haliotis TaxID=2013869 RepID=UPI000BB54326|nr:ABC transporter substrate-binding protein [Agaribacterium haliotis]